MAFVRRIYRRHRSLSILRAANDRRYYREAKELFLNTFAQHAVDDLGDRMAIIHLLRPPIEVAMSRVRLQQYLGTAVGNDWLMDSQAPSNRIQIADLLDSDEAFFHPFYRTFGYWHDVEMRIAAWRTRKPSFKTMRFETA